MSFFVYLFCCRGRKQSKNKVDGQGIIFVIRVFIVFLFMLVFAGLSIRCSVDERHLIFLIDESRSIDIESNKFIRQYLKDVFDSNKKFNYTLFSFARDTKLSNNFNEFAQQKLNRDPIYNQNDLTINNSDWSSETNIASAIMLASSLFQTRQNKNDNTNLLPNWKSLINGFFGTSDLKLSDCNYEIVLISDGNETIGNAIEAAVNCEIPISTVPIPESNLPEISVVEFDLPVELKSGAPFNIDLTIYSNQSTETAISIFRNEFKIHSETKKLSIGENKFRFQQTASDERIQEFRVVIESDNDTESENNYSSKIVMVGDQPRILIIDSVPEVLADFISAMSEQGLKIDVRPAEGIPKTASDFLQFDAVIISDLPASAFSLQQMNLLRDYVYEFGGGLIMIGGEHSFGQGGYYKTVIEDMLPVRCNFDDEQEKPTMAISLVIDRSGSMSGEKIKIAQAAAKSAVELLSADDVISIIAYDAIPHVLVPSQKVTSQSAIYAVINSLTSGGGTSIYPALQESYEQLNWLNTQSKHVILLTDGKSESGDYEALLKRMAGAGITVTIINIGEEDDEILQRAAELGNGRFYRVVDLNSVPQIFASEIMMSNKSAINEIPFAPIIVTKNIILDGISVDRIPSLLGFVRTTSKPASKIILATESGEPLLSWRRCGLGITSAFMSDVKNRWATEWLIWDEFAKLWSQIIRFTMKKQKLDNATIECKFIDGKIEVVVDIVDENEYFIDGAGGVMTVISPDLLQGKVRFKQIAAGRYKATFDTNTRGKYQLHIQLQSKEQQTILQHSRGIVIDDLNELRTKKANIKLLQKISEITNGNFAPSPSNIFLQQNKSTFRSISLRQYLFVTIILLFLTELFLRRRYN
ncbi:MAG: VWA domain-containing protein [Planctomycetaceae bacterium]|nr:VWA domain-containing protein [Planctomycetaceae bacterium]